MHRASSSGSSSHCRTGEAGVQESSSCHIRCPSRSCIPCFKVRTTLLTVRVTSRSRFRRVVLKRFQQLWEGAARQHQVAVAGDGKALFEGGAHPLDAVGGKEAAGRLGKFRPVAGASDGEKRRGRFFRAPVESALGETAAWPCRCSHNSRVMQSDSSGR